MGVMKRNFLWFLLFVVVHGSAQELYVFTEPASNMPAHSLGLKLGTNFITKNAAAANRFLQRYTPEVQFGISKKVMLQIGNSLSDMNSPNLRWESAYAYIKYRFLSRDDVHRHFRMAAFAKGAYSRSPFHFDDINLGGDKSGMEAGLVATQLINKLAISANISHVQVFDSSRNHKSFYIPQRNYQAMNYSLSAGFLLLPVQYRDYRQTNLNLYVELLGQQSLDRRQHYWDLAPALQFIFNSISKLNIGYRFQLSGNMDRMTKQSWQIAYVYTFLNALKKH
jgi:hypothetical protein